VWACEFAGAKALAPFLAPVKSVRAQKLVIANPEDFRFGQ